MRFLMQFSSAILLTAVTLGQQAESKKVHDIEINKTVDVLTADAGIKKASPAIGHCDADADLFLPVMIGRDDFGPILELSPEGKLLNRFAYRDAPGFTSHPLAFAMTDDGVYLLATRERAPHLLKPGDAPPQSPESFFVRLLAGEKQDKEVQLPADLVPLQLAVMTDGNLLVSGIRPLKQGYRAVLVIVERSGKLLHEVTLPEEFLGGDPVSALRFSVFEVAPDGYIYLLRRGTNGPVHMITPQGTLKNTLYFPGGAEMHLLGIQAESGLLIGVMGKLVPTGVPGSFRTENNNLVLVDTLSAAESSYSLPEGLGFGNVACVKKDKVYFLKNEDGRLKLLIGQLN